MLASRPDKLSHGQTILFEVDMLRFAAGKLLNVGKVDEQDKWVWLEDFLLHYRNLIEFLGHPKPRDTDLHVSLPDFLDGVPPPDPAITRNLVAGGSVLWENADTGSDIIAKYLHHCTMKRIDSKSWPVGAMNDSLELLLSDLTPLLAHVPRRWAAQPVVRFLGSASMSTASGPAPIGGFAPG